MKKSKLSSGLVTSFIAAMALTACGSVKAKDNALVTFTPYGSGEKVDIVTDRMYQKYHNTTDGISKFYSQILEVLIRYDFKKNGDGKNGMLTLKEIQDKAASDVKEQKQKARDNGDYDKEWKSILESYNVENEKELKEVFIYNREKEEISKWFLNENIEALKQEFIGIDKNGKAVDSKVDSALPYHIRHILIKTDASAGNFVNSTISSAEANKLYNAISKLKDGKQSFAQIAYDESEDGSGKEAYGDVGIMTNQITSSGTLKMVPEFQLGIYAYDAILSGQSTNENAAIANGLGATDSIKAKYNEAAKGLVKVPYSAIEELYNVRDVEKDRYGNELSDGNQAVYPRNILWNKYFNHHQVFVITNANRKVSETPVNYNNGTEAQIKTGVKEFTELTASTYQNLGANFISKTGVTTGDEKVLSDGKGNVILGVRSEFGIHLIVIQKSIYDYAGEVSLNDYYTTEVPSSKNYPTVNKGTEQEPNRVPADTYVNFINTASTSDYNKRANTVKDEIKGFDSTYDYRLYEKLMDEYKNDIKFEGDEGKTLKDSINNYLTVTRNSKKHNQETKLQKVWENYIDLLELQEQKRNEYYLTAEGKYKSAMIPEGCAVNFKKGGDDYKEGGKCYYAK